MLNNYEICYRIKGNTGIANRAVVVNVLDSDVAVAQIAKMHYVSVDEIELVNAPIWLQSALVYEFR
jgi:hypothetical protein